MKIILAYITALLTAFSAVGQNMADSVKVYFRVGQSQLDPSFADNRRRLEAFEAKVEAAVSGGVVDSIVIKGSTSPDGVSVSNVKLAEGRCDVLRQHLIRTTGIDNGLIRVYPEGVAWGELRQLVAAATDMPRQKEVLEILDHVPLWIYGQPGKITDGRKKRLMELAGGEPYRWMQEHLFPELRKGVAVSLFSSLPESTSKRVEIFEAVSDSVPENLTDSFEVAEELVTDTVPSLCETDSIPLDTIPVRPLRGFHMAVKTNMLFDALLIPNISAEFYLGSRMSVYGEWMYAWWDSRPRDLFWRTYGGDLGVRCWLGRRPKERPLTGHHIGLYGGILTFDFELGKAGYMGGKPGGTLWDRLLVVSGIEYGFSLPVAKRINIDFSIGVGYMGGKYIKYFPFDNDYYRDKEYKMHYWGPTKAEVSFVWLLGNGYSRNRKGGEE